jgi:hypothetical protein
MVDILQVLTVLLVVVTMALSLAHALELPGKMRLTREIYFAMQKTLTPTPSLSKANCTCFDNRVCGRSHETRNTRHNTK